MNICIYRTMRNQWYRQSNSPSGGVSGSSRWPGGFLRRRSTISGSGVIKDTGVRSGTVSGVSTPTRIRRTGGLNEAEYKKRDGKYTRASVVMVLAFMVCNTPRMVPNIMEIFISQDEFPAVSCPFSSLAFSEAVPSLRSLLEVAVY